MRTGCSVLSPGSILWAGTSPPSQQHLWARGWKPRADRWCGGHPARAIPQQSNDPLGNCASQRQPGRGSPRRREPALERQGLSSVASRAHQCLILLDIKKTSSCFTLCNLAYKYCDLWFIRNSERTKLIYYCSLNCG